MINKLKYLFIMILCVGVIGNVTAVSAQSGKILATAGSQSLRQSDIDRVIEFYEWAFAAKFTGEERRQYQSIKAEDFQNDPASVRKGIDDMVAGYAKIRIKSADEQERVRQAFNADYIGQLRGIESAEAKLLLNVYESANGGETTADAAAESDESTVGGDISALVGKWAWGRSGSSTLSTSGVYMGSNGSRYTYQFFPNGTVKFTGILNVMMGGCSQQVFQLRDGKASLSGNTLTINWAPEKFTRDFSCDTAHNYTKTLPAKTEKLQINFKTDLGQKQLCFVGAECFSPTKQ